MFPSVTVKMAILFIANLYASSSTVMGQSDGKTETAYAWYSSSATRVANLGDITIFTEAQAINHTKGDQFLFAPPDVQNRSTMAVNSYLKSIDPTGQAKLFLGELEQHEHCELATLDQTRQKILTAMDNLQQRNLRIPNPYGWHKIVLLDVKTGKITKELIVPKASMPSTGSSAR